jgi:hypothetical protein
VIVDDWGDVATTTSLAAGGSAWRAVGVDGANGLEAISCQSSSLCVALDDAGRVVTSTDPTAAEPAWAVGPIANFANDAGSGLACLSRNLCIGVGTRISCGLGCFSFGQAVTSTNPASGAASWTAAPIESDASDISCPSVRLCVAVGGQQISTSTQPAEGGATWKTITVNSAETLLGVSCPSVSLCVAVDGYGKILTSTDPLGGASAWKAVAIESPQVGLLQVSCASMSLCVADDNGGNVLSSTHPTGSATAWKAVHVTAARETSVGLGPVSCPSVSLCVVLDSGDHGVLTATGPTGSASAWRLTPLDPGSELASLSCPSAVLCAVGEYDGNVLFGTNPGVSRNAAVAALTAAIHHPCHSKMIDRVLQQRGCATPFSAPGAGEITITWLSRRGTRVASGTADVAAAVPVIVKVLLTTRGRRLLGNAAKPIRIQVSAAFKDIAGHRYTKTTSTTLTTPPAKRAHR